MDGLGVLLNINDNVNETGPTVMLWSLGTPLSISIGIGLSLTSEDIVLVSAPWNNANEHQPHDAGWLGALVTKLIDGSRSVQNGIPYIAVIL
jgi:hypothetical protein